MKGFFVTLSLLLVVSCATQSFPVRVDPSGRINNVSGVSVLPPQDKGWIIAQASTYQIAFIKQGSWPDSTYTALVTLFEIPKIESEEDYLQYVSKGRSAGPATGRFTTVINNEEIFRGRESYCVKYHSISEDRAAKTKSGAKSMIMETIGYCCQHPKNKIVGVDFGYSYRHYGGDEDADLEKKANAFLDQVQFTGF